MNKINKIPIENLGYNFIPAQYLKNNETEYSTRFQQNTYSNYRNLTDAEIAILYSNANKCSNWKNVFIKEDTDISLIVDCTFYGLIRIGTLQPFYLEYNAFEAPVGIYKSKIISCDLGDNVSIQNVKYLSHYIIENDVVLANINEMSCTSHAKFGNGILKEGEEEESRIWIELRNENAGRKIIPYDGMLAGDAWLWSKYRDNEKLMNCFISFTEKQFSNKRGFYGTVGTRTIIKNTLSIKDVKIGTDAYIKGATKLKNLTINSTENGKTQIGEGCELVNGILGEGSKAFYGVKAVRFILQPFSQLKYGARLINSYLGENATISCCEVLNSLIFPAHEQHHNNSFLTAALLKGQTNIAAGATIGSNHNSRGADGEIEAGRGFWPGLCVSLKHNSKFASFIIIVKGDYPAELNIPFPFSLINNNVHQNILEIMPAYWLLHNMYAIVRNEQKFKSRDQRIHKQQLLEFDFLAPDTITEIADALQLLRKYVGKSFYYPQNANLNDSDFLLKGKELLDSNAEVLNELIVYADDLENSSRKAVLLRARESYLIYKKMLHFYAAKQILNDANHISEIDFPALQNEILNVDNNHLQWLNVGGQLIKKTKVAALIQNCIHHTIQDWKGVHDFYTQEAATYPHDKFIHAIQILCLTLNYKSTEINPSFITSLLNEAITTNQWILEKIIHSKEKDYTNIFRKMPYDNQEEMNAILGSFEDNQFIKDQKKNNTAFAEKVKSFIQNE